MYLQYMNYQSNVRSKAIINSSLQHSVIDTQKMIVSHNIIPFWMNSLGTKKLLQF